MKNIKFDQFLGRISQFDDFLDRTEEKISQFKFETNKGGIQLQGALNVAAAFHVTKPDALIELGVFKGVSALFFEHLADKKMDIFCFDPRVRMMDKLIPTVAETAIYSGEEFATPLFSKLVETRKTNVLCFADDHQDVLERLFICLARGINYVLFDDDYRGRADHRSFYMLREQADNSPLLAQMLDLMVEEYIDLPDIDAWVALRPDVARLSKYDLSQHFRPMTLCKLAKIPGGWTAGAIENEGNRFMQKVYQKV